VSRERVRQIEVRAFEKVQGAVKNRLAAMEARPSARASGVLITAKFVAHGRRRNPADFLRLSARSKPTANSAREFGEQSQPAPLW